jgi:hypothetical protein
MPARRCGTPLEGIKSQIDPSSGKTLMYATPEQIQDYRNEVGAVGPFARVMVDNCTACRYYRPSKKDPLRGKCRNKSAMMSYGRAVGKNSCCNLWEGGK